MTEGTVLVHRTMSLDGFIAGPEHVLLGDGIPFSPGSGRVDLELVAVTRSGGLADLRYRVAR